MPPASKLKKPAKKGSIYMIELQNFMSYKSARFYPGQQFNVIFGPNGSGKSSIMTAIAIGLGGTMDILNRQKSFSDLINTSTDKEDKAIITIQLHTGKMEKNKHEIDEIVCKIGKHDKKPQYYLNNRRVDQTKIIEKTEEHQIQMRNMCQFLPQDVVREFPNMKPNETFTNTLRAVGNTKMLRVLEGLKGQQDELDNNVKKLETKKGTLNEMENKYQQNAKLRDDVQKRVGLTNKLDLCDKKQTRFEILNDRKKVKQADLKINELKTEKIAAQKEREKLKAEYDSFESKKNVLDEQNEIASRKIQEMAQKMKNSQVQKLEDEIENKDKNIKLYENKRIAHAKKLQNDKKDLAQKEQDLVNLNKPRTEEDLAHYEQERIELDNQIYEIEENSKDLANKISVHEGKIAHEKRKLQEKQSLDGQRLQLLHRRNQDAHQGVLWLRQNKHLFKNPQGVHEPIMMNLTLKTQFKEFALQLENSIGNQELEAFVCENQEDANLLMNTLRRKLNLKKINVVHSNPLENSNFANPSIQVKNSKFVFLDKVISDGVPKAVMKHLCLKKKLHLIPVFDRDPGRMNLKKYFVGKQRFDSISSRYTNKTSSAMSNISRERVNYLELSKEDLNTSEIEEEILSLTKKINEYKHGLQRNKAKENEIRQKLGNTILLEEQRRENLNNIQKLENDIRRLQEEIQNQESGKSVEEIIKESYQKRQELTRQLVSANKNLFGEINETIEWTIKSELNQLKLSQLENQTMEDRKNFQKADENVKALKEKIDSTSEELKIFKSKLAAKTKGITWKAPKDIDFPPELIEKMQDYEIPDTLLEVKARIESLKKELELCPKVTEAQIQEMQNQEERKRRQENEIRELEVKVKQLRLELQQAESSLVKDIENMIEVINEGFRDFMDQMNFAGEVRLSKGSHDLDIKNYGLEILVKFRDKDKLQPLSNSIQSGGEKSVTTALYMMALQKMTQVPFRCVDEINQGMDERNEQRVWNLLVETSNEHSAQFFYLAPKYPHNLEFEGNMTIHVCLNGHVNFGSKKRNYIEVDEVIKKKKLRSA